MNNENEVVLLDKLSIDQQIRVYKQAFNNPLEESELRARWEKKHYNNPCGNSLIFGVFINGELAGMNAYMPYSFNYNGVNIKCLQSCESGVPHRFQGRGIWGKIVRYAVEYVFANTDYEFIFGFPNYRNSYPGFVKMKWSTVGQMNNYLMINNASNFIKSLSTNRFLTLFSFPLTSQRLIVKVLSSRKLDIEECPSEDLLWQDRQDMVIVKPSIQWVNWKQDYKGQYFVSVKNKERIIATCIYGIETYNNQSYIRIDRISIVNNPNIGNKTIIATIVKHLSEKYPKIAFFRVWAIDGDDMNKLYKKLFFLKTAHPNPLIIKAPDEKYNEVKWQLSFYDLD